MRVAVLALATALVSTSAGVAAAAGTSDPICPEATPYLVAVSKLAKEDLAQKVYDTAQAAADAYARCSKDKLMNASFESQNYAAVRGTGLAVLASRALISLGRTDDARAELQRYRPIVQHVVDWDGANQTSAAATTPARPPSDESPAAATTTSGGGTGNRMVNASQTPDNVVNGRTKSAYRDAAKDLIVAIDGLLAKLNPPAGGEH